MNKYIGKLNFPHDLKDLSEHELELLADEIRMFLIDKVSKTGGHLASNLGVVELTIALHTIFESPKDKLIWDVGHQSYIHKILTGRAIEFDTLRQFNGLSGFPKKEESPHDFFDSGHSSNSISVGLGIAKARDIRKEDFSVVVVIGDGALTGGIAYEALNNAGHGDTNLIIILNDNEMSISENIGGISKHLCRLRTAPAYTEIKKKVKTILKKIPKVGNGLYLGLEKVRDTIKYTVVSGILFEELGFTYLGPVDGHNMHEMLSVLCVAKKAKGPVIIHTLTKKGKGYKSAEKQPDKFHGIGPFISETGEVLSKSRGESYSSIFGKKMIKIAEQDKSVVAITAAMADGTGLKEFSQKYPDRFFDVGIAEQHAITFAAGLALNGMKPVVTIYSTFLQRAYDQIMMDVCLQNLPVVICVDRGGIVGEDGETHHGIFDISYLNHMPNMTILAPKDKNELEAMIDYGLKLGKPCAIRYPRGNAVDLSEISNRLEIDGTVEVITEGSDLCIVAVGRMVQPAYEASEILKQHGIHACVLNARFIKPLNERTYINIFKNVNRILTIEDNTIIGGFGNSIGSLVQKHQLKDTIVFNMGWPDKYIEHGLIKELDKKYGLDAEGIVNNVFKLLNRRS